MPSWVCTWSQVSPRWFTANCISSPSTVVSRCLGFEPVRYNGQIIRDDRVQRLADGLFIMEALSGGLVDEFGMTQDQIADTALYYARLPVDSNTASVAP